MLIIHSVLLEGIVFSELAKETTQEEKPIIAKAPGQPVFVSKKFTNVVLKWKPSRTPGNISYKLEHKTTSERYWMASSTKEQITSCETTVWGLAPTTSYVFRVVPYIRQQKGIASLKSKPISTGLVAG